MAIPVQNFDPTPKLPPFPERSVSVEKGLTRFETLVTPDLLKADFLFGIPLKSNLTKQELSNDTLRRYIIRAVSRLETELKINISPVKYTDRYDYNLWDYQKYNFIQINHWPILQVESFRGKYPNAVDFIQFPQEWLSVYNEFGMFQLTPTNGAITQFFLTNDATYLPLLLGSRAQWPQLWEITYTSGFENDKIPAMINNLIAQNAALQALRILNPILFPYTSYGIGIDGTSQSVGGPGPQLFTERINEIKEDYAELMSIAKSYWNRRLLMSAL